MRHAPWRPAVRFVALLTLIACLASVAVGVPASAQTVRDSITALTPAELMSLRRGVATMKSRDSAPRNSADFRRSWLYWANMHAHFGNDCGGRITGGSMTGIQTWTASNQAEDATWCTCEHGTAQFLTWHRMFTWYFERVLRQASGDPNLTLPYWDYAATPRLPAALREQTYLNANGQRVPNPLYAAERRAALNEGTAGLAATVSSSANAMQATSRTQFEQRLEATPHGSVHCSVANGGCPNGLMGAVPSAGLDPIFYLHHANTDRLYECWLRVDMNARLPTSQTILNRNYSFVDRNGSVVQRRVRDMLTTTQIGYSYSPGGAGCPPASASLSTALTAQTAAPLDLKQVAQAPSTSSTELKRGLTEVALPLPSAAAAPYGRRVPKSVTVIIEGVNAAVVPGVVYNVYLADAAGRRVSIGVISFFGLGGARAGSMHPHGGMSGRTFEFDATQALETLELTGSRSAKLVIEPTTGLTDSTLAAATAAIPKNAKVTFASARLTLE